MANPVPNVTDIWTAVLAEVGRLLGRRDFELHLPEDFIIRAPANAIGEGQWIIGESTGDGDALAVFDEAVRRVRAEYPIARL